MAKLPVVALKKGEDKRLRFGHPWAFSNEIQMDAQTKALPPGSLVALTDAGGVRLGVATFNPHSLIAARLLDRDAATAIDRDFIAGKIANAAALRERLIGAPYYRLIHAEADGLPGLIVDRFGEVLALQANTAGMEKLTPLIVEALEAVLKPKAIVARNDSSVRALEGLPQDTTVLRGEVAAAVPLQEYGATFFADLATGQKTGWFYDQRDNRRFAAELAKGARVLDAYCYAGGFAVQAAKAGATSVLALDRSEPALALAARAAEANGVGATVNFQRGEVFAALEKMEAAKERFGLVIADPPAFVKSRKDLKSGAQGYRKLARLAAALVEPGGFLMIASCSHLVDPPLFAEQVRRGLSDNRRSGRILRSLGAAPDHPVHPALPETAYLKALFLQLD
ncbi:MAG: class I SAM-dependent rRNA methyltransferase [Reyranellaceae bacterium]